MKTSNLEWLESDGKGGFSMGTASGIPTRRYHSLLTVPAPYGAGRYTLVNQVETFVTVNDKSFPLSSFFYAPAVTHPQGHLRIASFEAAPSKSALWPTWTYNVGDALTLSYEIVSARELSAVILVWKLNQKAKNVSLVVRPLISCRDYHGLTRENSHFNFQGTTTGETVCWKPYHDLPCIVAQSNGTFRDEPTWYRNFLYSEERARGHDHIEDLASPGVFKFDLKESATLIFRTDDKAWGETYGNLKSTQAADKVRKTEEKRRNSFGSVMERAAESYLIRRGNGKTVIAGYPWFTDWGRDTFISLRGLCLASGDIDDARAILLQWSSTISKGMIPNRFPDGAGDPEYNAVDASLWYIISIQCFFDALAKRRKRISNQEREALLGAIQAILEGYSRGTRYQIHAETDGLLASGEPGVQLTWMDAKVGDWVVTPRTGKAVEIQALWLNAVAVGASYSKQWSNIYEKGLASFAARFWNEEQQCLYDVVDVDHQPGRNDAAVRPNQIFAVGGLPHMIIDGKQAEKILQKVESELYTPIGLRSLSPRDSAYRGIYQGGPLERDGAYHQGTVWPWLLGAFVEAWVRVNGATSACKKEARERFLKPLLSFDKAYGAGHLPEIADGDSPHQPRGCPFQAWSVAEAIRIDKEILA